MIYDFEKQLSNVQASVNCTLNRILPSDKFRLIEAMRYSVLSFGKRLRPFLLYQSSDLFHVSDTAKETVAAALEMIHCFSLIHDDLPAMDNDHLRRGLPTVHIAFDEATAILAGDALLVYGFDLLASPSCHEIPEVRLQLITEMTQAIGHNGMIAGQMMDVDVSAQPKIDFALIKKLQHLKTGRLIEFSCRAGGILGRASDSILDLLGAYARDVGLAFQITDDLLDICGTTDALGKQTQKDHVKKKAVLIELIGEKDTRRYVDFLIDRAISSLRNLGEGADGLRAFAVFVRHRKI